MNRFGYRQRVTVSLLSIAIAGVLMVSCVTQASPPQIASGDNTTVTPVTAIPRHSAKPPDPVVLKPVATRDISSEIERIRKNLLSLGLPIATVDFSVTTPMYVTVTIAEGPVADQEMSMYVAEYVLRAEVLSGMSIESCAFVFHEGMSSKSVNSNFVGMNINVSKVLNDEAAELAIRHLLQLDSKEGRQYFKVDVRTLKLSAVKRQIVIISLIDSPEAKNWLQNLYSDHRAQLLLVDALDHFPELNSKEGIEIIAAGLSIPNDSGKDPLSYFRAYFGGYGLATNDSRFFSPPPTPRPTEENLISPIPTP